MARRRRRRRRSGARGPAERLAVRRGRPAAGGGPTKQEAAATRLVRRIEMTSEFDRREAEALRVEIWGLARRYGIRLKSIRVEAAGED